MSSAPFCTHGNLPYSTKWRGSTLGLVPLILYSRPVPHQQVHILPIKDTFPPSTFALSAPCLGLVTTGHLPYSTKWGGPTLGLVCLILYSRPVPHKQTHQQDPVTTTYSTKWGAPTLGFVSLILYSRPVPHKQAHQQDPVTSTKFHHILPIKDAPPPLPFEPPA